MNAKRKQCSICPSDFIRIGARPEIRAHIVRLLRGYFLADGSRVLAKANQELGIDATEAEFYFALSRNRKPPKVREWLEKQPDADNLFR